MDQTIHLAPSNDLSVSLHVLQSLESMLWTGPWHVLREKLFLVGDICAERRLDMASVDASVRPLLDVTRQIEKEALLLDTRESPGMQRLERTANTLVSLRFIARWQGPLVAVVMVLMFLVTGREIVPYYPEVDNPWLKFFIVLFHSSCVFHSAAVFLILSSLHWMALMCVDCATHLLIDRVNDVRSWRQLLELVGLHQQLVFGLQRVQACFAEDLSLVVRLMLILGVIGAVRMSLGIRDVSNTTVWLTIFAYITMVCVAAQMQENAGEEFHFAIRSSCPWEAWGTKERHLFSLLVMFTRQPPEVRFLYFGALRLSTLSNIFNAVFKYTQVLRASIGDTAGMASGPS
ncbi:uncharacterized protein LOC113207118 isoform X2 [Frankliniella occidentalis]|uniref:Uncharacterized protein LOC113207118 isoform X2 n=1 Tax=Frankliniella occidentalis TaxID=133901 RepID=A0A6J1SJ00_FRAOC|nr:uncharacterized protein LOC113207118 isoform X2 [Frankliniella occidentalis]